MATQPQPQPGPTAPSTTPDTLDTLSLRAAQADLGPIDPMNALQIKVCEERLNAKHAGENGRLAAKLQTVKERYRACLRELRERYTAIKMEDFAKFLVGLSSGLTAKAFSDKGIDALKEGYVSYLVIILILSILFILIRYFAPTKRRKEIKQELEEIDREF